MNVFLQIVVCFSYIGTFGNGYKIIFIAMPEGKSHRGSMYPFATALQNRGHDVTIFSEVPNQGVII